MAYVGYIAHELPGRVRIKVAASSGDQPFFARLVEEISSLPSVLEVRANAHATSVTVVADPRSGPLRSALEHAGLFEFRERPSERGRRPRVRRLSGPRPDSALALGLSGLGVVQLINGEVTGSASENFWNAYRTRSHLGNSAFPLLLTALGVVQLLRGQYLNSATALFSYALTAWHLSREKRPGGRAEPYRTSPPIPRRGDRVDQSPVQL